MKKVLLLVLLFYIKEINAQAPTITADYLPKVGDTYNNMVDEAPGDMINFTVTAGSSSPQTWDYSKAFDITSASTTTYFAPKTDCDAYSGSNLIACSIPDPCDYSGVSFVAFASNSTGFSCIADIPGYTHGGGK